MDEQTTECRTGDVAAEVQEGAREAKSDAERAKDGASSVGHKISDAIEDIIPGDSDRDGH